MFSLASLLSKSYTKIWLLKTCIHKQENIVTKVHIIIIVVMNISYHKIVLQNLL